MEFLARCANEEDLTAVLEVENASKREVGREYLEGELHNPVSRFYLAESLPDGLICAYLLAWRLDERDFEIHHLAVLPGLRKRGLARGLIDHLIRAHRDGLKRIFLEVRQSNREAVSFYEAFGFVRRGIRRDYYRNPTEDALLYQYSVSVER